VSLDTTGAVLVKKIGQLFLRELFDTKTPHRLEDIRMVQVALKRDYWPFTATQLFSIGNSPLDSTRSFPITFPRIFFVLLKRDPMALEMKPFKLHSASAIMCRSVLEEVVEKRLRRLNIDALQELRQTDYTLGVMLGLTERPDLRSRNIVPFEALHAAQAVNRLGGTTVHERPSVKRKLGSV
jgi:hypothetical protein